MVVEQRVRERPVVAGVAPGAKRGCDCGGGRRFVAVLANGCIWCCDTCKVLAVVTTTGTVYYREVAP